MRRAPAAELLLATLATLARPREARGVVVTLQYECGDSAAENGVHRPLLGTRSLEPVCCAPARLGSLRPAPGAQPELRGPWPRPQEPTFHHTGDLPTCGYTNDGECDDGGPAARYWECPRFSDATDCGTLCSEHSGALPPPPPSCQLGQWASSAEASSSYSEHYAADQAAGAPSHPMTCTPGRIGSWAPLAMNDDNNWLIAWFQQPVYPEALLVHEHANPPEESGFVTKVDLYLTSSLSWLEGVWVIKDDSTPCGGVLTLRAEEATLPLHGVEVSGCRIRHPSWLNVPATLFDDSAPSARLVPPWAQAAPMQPRAPPEHLGSSPWPEQLPQASGFHRLHRC